MSTSIQMKNQNKCMNAKTLISWLLDQWALPHCFPGAVWINWISLTEAESPNTCLLCKADITGPPKADHFLHYQLSERGNAALSHSSPLHPHHKLQHLSEKAPVTKSTDLSQSLRPTRQDRTDTPVVRSLSHLLTHTTPKNETKISLSLLQVAWLPNLKK